MAGKSDASSVPAGGANVFVSYSRIDREFARQIYLALEDEGFSPLMDVQAINPAEPWQDRLTSLIEQCDTVVFIVSENFLGSEACTWETQEAQRMGKRMIPVLPGPLGDAKVPDFLSRLQYVHFYPEPKLPDTGFYDGTRKLSRALRLNLEWLREARIYAERAVEYRNDPIEARLVKGALLRQAHRWLEATPEGEQVPPGVADWINESQRVETKETAQQQADLRRRARNARITFVTGLVLAIAAIVGGWASISYSLGADEANSRTFASQANTLVNRNEIEQALLLALHGDPAADGTRLRQLFRPEGFEAAALAIRRANARNTLEFQTELAIPGLTAASVSQDGRLVAVGTKGGGVQIVPLRSDVPSPKLEPLQSEVSAIAIDPNGRFLVAGSRGGEADDGSEIAPVARVFDLETGEELATMVDHEGAVAALAISPDGRQVLSAASDGERHFAYRWAPETGDLLTYPYGYYTDDRSLPTRVSSLAFSPDNQFVVLAMESGRADLYAMDDIEPSVTYDHSGGQKAGLSYVSFSPDGDYVMTAADNGTIKVWTRQTAQNIRTLGGHSSGIIHVEQSRTYPLLLSATSSGEVYVWRSDDDKPIKFLESGRARILDARFSDDGKELRLAQQSGLVRWWRTPGRDVETSMSMGRRQVFDLSVAPENGEVFAATTAGSLFHYGPDGQLVQRLALDGARPGFPSDEEVRAMAVVDRGDERFAIVGGTDSLLTAFSLSTGEKQPLQRVHQNWINAIAVSPDGTRFAAASEDGTISIWSIDDLSLIARLLTARDGPGQDELAVNAIAFSPNGERLAIGLNGGAFRLISATTGETEHEFQVRKDPIESIAFSPNGQQVATAEFNGGVFVWSTNQEAYLSHIGQHAGSANAVVYASDGSMIASGGNDELIKIWPNPISGSSEIRRGYVDRANPAALFSGHLGEVTRVAFNADGQIVSAANDGTVKVWTMPDVLTADPAETVRLSCQQLADLGNTGLEDADRKAFPILASPLIESPCKGVLETETVAAVSE